MKESLSPVNYPRMWARIHPDTKARVAYWATSHGLTQNEYVAEAIEEKIRRENGDYDLPTLEMKRLNEIRDLIASFLPVLENMISESRAMNTLITRTARGDNYLLDADADSNGGGNDGH